MKTVKSLEIRVFGPTLFFRLLPRFWWIGKDRILSDVWWFGFGWLNVGIEVSLKHI